MATGFLLGWATVRETANYHNYKISHFRTAPGGRAKRPRNLRKNEPSYQSTSVILELVTPLLA